MLPITAQSQKNQAFRLIPTAHCGTLLPVDFDISFSEAVPLIYAFIRLFNPFLCWIQS
ncbi:hypothetical protein PSEUDO8Z_100061 [Pseudomonas sp. 8Z]|nr:hypothetical protein PSEUDO8Z_100061 [Pseudomonas sp. 8Z]